MKKIILLFWLLTPLIVRTQSDTMGCFCLRGNKLFITVRNTSDTVLELPNRIRKSLINNQNVIRGADFLTLTINHDSFGNQVSIVTPAYSFTPGVFAFAEVLPHKERRYLFYISRIYSVKDKNITKVFLLLDNRRIFLLQYQKDCYWRVRIKRRHRR